MVQIIWMPQAESDLKKISDFISQDSSENADLFVKSLIKKVKNLHNFPQMGRIVPEIEDSKIRELIYQSYRIVYNINNDIIEIRTILNSRQLFRIN